MIRPEVIDEAIVLDPKRYLVSETDPKGVITYCNDYFVEVSGYSREELIGQPHNIIRHPDMPKVVFKLLWSLIENGQNINAVVKNLAKDGRYYWVFTEFNIRQDPSTHEVIGYTASRKTVSKHIIEIITSLYDELLEIEKREGVDAAERYLDAYIKERDPDIGFESIMENIHKFY